jgi:hypothetical protein
MSRFANDFAHQPEAGRKVLPCMIIMALLNWRMIFGGRDVPWNVSTRILNVCKIIFIPKISNAIIIIFYSYTVSHYA